MKGSRGYFIYAKLRIRPMSVRCILVPRARLSWSRALLLQLRVTLGTRTRTVQFLHEQRYLHESHRSSVGCTWTLKLCLWFFFNM